MRKIGRILICACAALSATAALTSCNDDENVHEHVFEKAQVGEYVSTLHHNVTCIECGEIVEESHTYSDGTNCDYCLHCKTSLHMGLVIYIDSYSYANIIGIGDETSDHIIIPNGYRGTYVIEIQHDAFRNEPITAIELGKYIETIGGASFYGSSLSEFIFPENCALRVIEDSAFSFCKNLETFVVPFSVEYLGAWEFYECTNLVEISFEDGSELCNIQEAAFRDCTSLTSIVIPNKVKEIGRAAFCNCSSLNYIVLPSSLEILGQEPNNTYPSVFSDCDSLTAIYYEGTEEQWEQIEMCEEDKEFVSSRVLYSDGWEYKNGVPTPLDA